MKKDLSHAMTLVLAFLSLVFGAAFTDRVQSADLPPSGAWNARFHQDHTDLPPFTLTNARENPFVQRMRCPAEEPELCDPETRLPPLMLPDLLTLPPHDLRLATNQANGRILLRFSNSVMNLGWGPAEVWGERENPEDHTVDIIQQIYRADGSSFSLPLGSFVFHPIHGHWHWDNFSQYEVWTVDSAGALLERAASSGKVGYCLRDNTLAPDEIIEQVGVSPEWFKPTMGYGDCGWRRQGISPGWVDTYRYHLAGQYVDITDLHDGQYALVSVVDPDNRLKESIEDNNAAWVYFRLADGKLEAGIG